MKPIWSWFGKVREGWKYADRTKLYEGLLTLGVKADLAECGHPEEKIGGSEGSVCSIEIRDSLFRCVNVIHRSFWELINQDEYDGRTQFHYEYLIPDPNMEAKFAGLRIDCFLIKRKGKVVDLEWRSNKPGAPEFGKIGRLSQDDSLRQPLVTYYDSFFWRHDYSVSIKACPEQGCWLLTTWIRGGLGNTTIPSMELWNCYEAIARHLLSGSDTY